MSFGKLDFLADYHFAMSGERACGLWWLDYIDNAGLSGLNDLVFVGDELGVVEQLKQLLGRAAFRLIPTGWFDQNKLSLCRTNEKYLLPLVGDQDRRIISPAAIQQANSTLERQSRQGWATIRRFLAAAAACPGSLRREVRPRPKLR